MLYYTRNFLYNMFQSNECTKIISSKFWYKDRINFSISEISNNRIPINETHGYEVLNGTGTVVGKLLGGNLEALYEAYVGDIFLNEKNVLKETNILPLSDEWKNKIMFFDTNEHSYDPTKILNMLIDLDKYIHFSNLKCVMIAKPINETYYNEYKKIYTEFFKEKNVPVIYNINFGHASPRCFIPYGVKCSINLDKKQIIIKEKMFN